MVSSRALFWFFFMPRILHLLDGWSGLHVPTGRLKSISGALGKRCIEKGGEPIFSKSIIALKQEIGTWQNGRIDQQPRRREIGNQNIALYER